ncbi:hypothetical protein DRO31_06850 [Candidatus Bathyarchaeota archaeon]|nr:MAG: hypothetical protein DRO31_06850 [Candidatus Bathyarchaeota archaeon]
MLSIIEMIGADPTKTLYIGDTTTDLTTTKAAKLEL